MDHSEAVVRIFMGVLGLAIGGGLYFGGFWTLLFHGGVTVGQWGMLLAVLIMVLALAVSVGERVFAALLGLAMLGWLYFRGFCSLFFYSYDPILRPGVLFLMLTMLIALIRIFHPNAPRSEKLVSGIVILLVLITSIGSNNGIYPSLNNLFLAAPYTLWQSWRFLMNVKETQIWKVRLSVLPAKGLLTAFLALCLFQFGMFGVVFVFAEATGVQNPNSYVENNGVLQGIRMSEDKARWLTEVSAYVEEQGLQGREVILYGDIPSLSYYLQMPAAFNPWCNLDSYSLARMEQDLGETVTIMETNPLRRPVVIVERTYVAYLAGGRSALEELGIAEGRIQKIEQDGKWMLLMEFMEENGYAPELDNEKFTLYR